MKIKPQEQYVYAVTRIHANEKYLLNAQDLEQMAAASDLAGAMRVLSEKGWGSPTLSPNDTDALIGHETDRTWKLIGELMGGDASFDVVRISDDYHNLKAAIKLVWLSEGKADERGCFLKHGTVSAERILKAAEENDFGLLPDTLAAVGREAYEMLTQTKSGQMVDIVIDRAALVAIDAAGKKSESRLLGRYATMTVDMANIKSAVRCLSMKKSETFAAQVIAPCGSLDTQRLVKAATMGGEEIAQCLKGTEYEDAIDKLKQSVSAFESWCGDKIISLIKPQLKNYFTIEPIAAYILARDNEIKLARLILSAKQNSISAEALRERLRDTYV